MSENSRRYEVLNGAQYPKESLGHGEFQPKLGDWYSISEGQFGIESIGYSGTKQLKVKVDYGSATTMHCLDE